MATAITIMTQPVIAYWYQPLVLLMHPMNQQAPHPPRAHPHQLVAFLLRPKIWQSPFPVAYTYHAGMHRLVQISTY